MTGACFECGAPSDHDHHVVPRSLGGTATVPLCVRCHALVHDSALVTAQHLSVASKARSKAKRLVYSREPEYGVRQTTDRTLEESAEEVHAMARIRELRAGGMTIRAIVAQLAVESIPARHSATWALSVVSRIANDGREATVKKKSERLVRARAEYLSGSTAP